MTDALVPIIISSIGNIANEKARHSILQDYQERKSDQTLRKQKADIELFEKFLAIAGYHVKNLVSDLSCWHFVTWGLVEAFVRWHLTEGYATASVNSRITTIKIYCGMAAKAAYLSTQELALIKMVKGYYKSEARNIDEKRVQTRRPDAKKAQPVSLSPVHASLLKDQPDTARGRRDRLIMCLLLDHALRVGEVAGLDIDTINLQSGELTFYRHKVSKTQTHILSPDTYKAAQAYLADCEHDQGPLFVGICSKARIDTSSINYRVGQLGDVIGIKGLSPHDCRHYYATDAIRNGTDIKSLQDAGGWDNPIMPLKYAASAKVANAGVKLSAYKKD